MLRRFVWAVTLVPVLAVASTAIPAGYVGATEEPATLQKASGLGPRCRHVKIDSVSFMDGGRRGWYLYVGGLRRFSNMTVSLQHRSLSAGMLTLDVIGCTPNFIALPIPTPYNVELALKDVPRARTIRLVGSNGQVTRRVPR